jgi:hypothetical protein
MNKWSAAMSRFVLTIAGLLTKSAPIVACGSSASSSTRGTCGSFRPA